MSSTSARAQRAPHRALARLITGLVAVLLGMGLSLTGAVAAHADNPSGLTASDVQATTRQGQAVVIQLQGSAPAGDQVAWSVSQFGPGAPSHGTVSFAFTSTVTYTPAAGFSGVDSFTYHLSDSTSDSPPATVTVTVTPTPADNHAPVASSMSVSVESGEQVTLPFAGTDTDGDSLSYRVIAGPTHGSVLTGGGVSAYEPQADFTGSDAVTYVANDGALDSAPATISITVTPARANTPPTSVPPTVTTVQDTPVQIKLTATDADGDQVWFEPYGNATHGTVTGDDQGNVTYTPALGFTGTDSFNYDVTDHRSTSPTYLITVTVTPAAVPAHTPTARSFDVNARQGASTPISLQGTDPDGDALTYSVTVPPAHGTLSGSGKDLVYTSPSTSFDQSDSFTYTVSDGVHTSSPAQVLITLLPAQAPGGPTPADVESTDRASTAGVVTAPALSGGQLLLAFISADGPQSTAQKVTSVSGGGLTWSLVRRANTWGTAEVWQAWAGYQEVSNVVVTAKLAKAGYDASLTVVGFDNAGPAASSAAASGSSGAPRATITPRQAGATVWAVGHDWSRAVTPQPLPGQTIAHAFADTRSGDSFWVQGTTADLPDAPVVMGASVPKGDRWQFVAVEIPFSF